MDLATVSNSHLLLNSHQHQRAFRSGRLGQVLSLRPRQDLHGCWKIGVSGLSPQGLCSTFNVPLNVGAHRSSS